MLTKAQYSYNWGTSFGKYDEVLLIQDDYFRKDFKTKYTGNVLF